MENSMELWIYNQDSHYICITKELTTGEDLTGLVIITHFLGLHSTAVFTIIPTFLIVVEIFCCPGELRGENNYWIVIDIGMQIRGQK